MTFPLRRAELAASALTLLAAVVLLYPGAATLGETFFFHDLAHHHYPWRVWAAREWMAGRVPLWTDLAACGFPLLADGQAGVLYPPNALFLFFSGTAALSLSVLFHTWLAGFLMYLWMRNLGLRPAASAVAAATFGFSGFFLTHLLYLPMYHGYPWLPGLCLCVDRLVRHKEKTPALFLAMGVAMVLLAGHPQLAVYALFFLFTYAGWRVFRGYPEGLEEGAVPDRQGRMKALPWGAGAATLGIILALPQLQATAELTALSQRAGGVDTGFAAMGSLPPQEVIQAVLPRFFGYERPADVPLVYHHHGDRYWGSGENYWEDAFFLGVPGVLLALLCLLRRPQGSSFFLAWMLLSSLLMLGPLTPAYPLFRLIPGMGFFRFPVRFAYLLTVAVAVAASFAVEQVCREREGGSSSRTIRRFAGVVVGGLLLAWGGGAVIHGMLEARQEELVEKGRGFFIEKVKREAEMMANAPPGAVPPGLPLPPPSSPDRPPDWVATGYSGDDYYGWKTSRIVEELLRNTDPLGARVLLPLTMALATALLLLLLGRWRAIAFGFAALQLADLLAFGWGYNPTTPREEIEEAPEILTLLGTPQGTPPPRVSGFERHIPVSMQEEAMSASLNMLWGWPDVVFPSPLRMVRSDVILSLSGQAITIYPTEMLQELVKKHRRLVDLLGIRYLVTREDLGASFVLKGGSSLKVYENPSALPRAFLVGDVVVGKGEWGFVEEMTRLGFDPAEQAVLDAPLSSPLSGGAVSGGAVVEKYQSQEVVVRTQGDRPALLVLTDTAYPGWRAEVDGKEAPIHVTNGMFRGVPVPEGAHRVTFRYDNPPFFLLLWLGALGWFVWFLGLSWTVLRGRPLKE